MQEALRKLFIGLASQAPLLGSLYVYWEHVRQKPLAAGLMAVLYEALVVAVGFGKKVWGKLEPEAVEYTASAVRSGIAGFAPGYLRRYRRQMVIDHGVFNVRGMGLIDACTLNLDHVFVELRVETSSNPAGANLDPIAVKELTSSRTIWEFLRSVRRKSDSPVALAVIGPPGCGKTTLLQHVAITLAANRQRRYHSSAYIPVLLVLRQHIKDITQANPPTLAALIEKHLNEKKQKLALKPAPGWFEKRLERGKCMVLLDGLDEVAELEQRKKVSEWIDDQIANYSESVFVLTARPLGYREAPLKRAHVFEVLPFTAGQARRFVENWYKATEIVSAGNKDDEGVRQRAESGAKDLLDRISKKPTLTALMVNPLLLTMVAMVHRYHGALPGSRVELYAEICQVLLGRWRQSRGIEEKLNAAQKLVVLQPLAAHMMKSNVRDISSRDAMSIIRNPLERVGVVGVEAEEFLTKTQSGSGLILERETGVWSFAHLTFQEYMAAAHLLAQKDGAQCWSDMVSDSWHHEMLRLYAAQGNATPLADACLSSGTVEALTLAADFLEEAREINIECRRAIEQRLIEGLESTEPERRRIAAEVMLSRRLQSLLPIGDGLDIDLNYLTCAEYQLFLDEIRAQGQYRQPDHWTDVTFAAGMARQPISGVRGEDALAFCEWLSRRQGGSIIYRLPTEEEARSYRAKTDSLAAWCMGENGLTLAGQPVEGMGDARNELPYLQWLDYEFLLEFILYPSMRFGLGFFFGSPRDRDGALTIYYRTFSTANARERFRVRARDFVRDVDSARELTGELARVLAGAHEKGIDFAVNRACDLALDQDLAVNGLPHLSLHLAGALHHDFASLHGALARFLDGALALDRELGAVRFLDDRYVDVDLARTLASTLIGTLIHAVANIRLRFLILALKRDCQVVMREPKDPSGYEQMPSASMDDLNKDIHGLGALLKEMLLISDDGPSFSARKLQRACLSKIVEFGLKGIDICGKEYSRSWRSRLWRKREQPYLEELQRNMLNMQEWLQTVMAREEGKLPAWEGLRVVREMVEPGARIE